MICNWCKVDSEAADKRREGHHLTWCPKYLRVSVSPIAPRVPEAPIKPPTQTMIVPGIDAGAVGTPGKKGEAA